MTANQAIALAMPLLTAAAVGLTGLLIRRRIEKAQQRDVVEANAAVIDDPAVAVAVGTEIREIFARVHRFINEAQHDLEQELPKELARRQGRVSVNPE
jgi:hypothetical protein